MNFLFKTHKVALSLAIYINFFSELLTLIQLRNQYGVYILLSCVLHVREYVNIER